MTADRVFPTGEGRALLLLKCNIGGRGECNVPLNTHGPKFGAVKNWGWDGNVDEPSITPSIQCDECNLHITITKGKRT